MANLISQSEPARTRNSWEVSVALLQQFLTLGLAIRFVAVALGVLMIVLVVDSGASFDRLLGADASRVFAEAPTAPPRQRTAEYEGYFLFLRGPKPLAVNTCSIPMARGVTGTIRLHLTFTNSGPGSSVADVEGELDGRLDESTNFSTNHGFIAGNASNSACGPVGPNTMAFFPKDGGPGKVVTWRAGERPLNFGWTANVTAKATVRGTFDQSVSSSLKLDGQLQFAGSAKFTSCRLRTGEEIGCPGVNVSGPQQLPIALSGGAVFGSNFDPSNPSPPVEFEGGNGYHDGGRYVHNVSSESFGGENLVGYIEGSWYARRIQ